jgi:hypothetical protein
MKLAQSRKDPKPRADRDELDRDAADAQIKQKQSEVVV